MPQHKTVKHIINLPKGTFVDNILAIIKGLEKRRTQSNDIYYSLILADKETTIEARIWSDAFSSVPVEKLKQGLVVLVDGTINIFNNTPQLIISKAQILDNESYDTGLLFPLSDTAIEQLWLQLMDYINQISNLKLRHTLKTLFTSIDIQDKFKYAPGGEIVHHAYRGGLLEHTLEVTEIALSIYKHYADWANKDVIIAGALLHDIGKIFEYDQNSNKRTLSGYLIGHIVMGMELFNKYWGKDVAEDEKNLRQHIIHIILSHHSELEQGAVVRPATIEAAIVAQADLASSTVKQFAQEIGKVDPNTKQAPYNRFIRTKVIKL